MVSDAPAGQRETIVSLCPAGASETMVKTIVAFLLLVFFLTKKISFRDQRL